MAEVVNLRQARKQRARAGKQRKAGENRARFGRTKAERTAAADTTERRDRTLDGARREPPEDEPR